MMGREGYRKIINGGLVLMGTVHFLIGGEGPGGGGGVNYLCTMNCSEFGDKMSLIIRMKTFSNVKHRNAIYLKFQGRFSRLCLC